MSNRNLKVVHRVLPTMDMLLNGGMTIKTQRLEDGSFEASSPNYTELKPAAGKTSLEARESFNRRLMAYINTQCDVEKANAADVSLTSRDPITM